MDNQEEYIPSREELIRMARESCTKNMYPSNINSKDYNSIKYKDNYYDTRSSKKTHVSAGDRTKSSLSGIQSFVIRIICAVVIFAAVFAMDRLNLKLYSFDSDYVLNCISTNEGVEAAQDYAVSVFENLVNSNDKEKE